MSDIGVIEILLKEIERLREENEGLRATGVKDSARLRMALSKIESTGWLANGGDTRIMKELARAALNVR